PSQQAALLGARTAGDYPHRPYLQCGQPGTQGGQGGGPGDQGREPEHLTGDDGALINYAKQKTGLATVTHEFVVPTAEVQQRLPLGVSAEIAPLALAAPGCFGQVGMEGGIAQGEIEALVSADQTPEDLLGPPLVAQFDVDSQRRVGGQDLRRIGQGGLVNVASDKAPAVFAAAQQGIDQIGPG